MAEDASTRGADRRPRRGGRRGRRAAALARSTQYQRSIENYLKAGNRPRWMERLVEIDAGIARERERLAAAYERSRAEATARGVRARWRETPRRGTSASSTCSSASTTTGIRSSASCRSTCARATTCSSAAGPTGAGARRRLDPRAVPRVVTASSLAVRRCFRHGSHCEADDRRCPRRGLRGPGRVGCSCPRAGVVQRLRVPGLRRARPRQLHPRPRAHDRVRGPRPSTTSASPARAPTRRAARSPSRSTTSTTAASTAASARPRAGGASATPRLREGHASAASPSSRRTGAKLQGHIWGTDAPGPRPGVVITTGSIQASDQMYWWAARALAGAGLRRA